MGVVSHVNTKPLLRGIQQTLPEIDWNTEPLCKSLVVFLLVVVTDILECIVQLSVASAATTTKSSVLKLTIAVSQLLSFFCRLGCLASSSFFNKKECFLHFSGHRGENMSAAFAVITSPRADKVNAGNHHHHHHHHADAETKSTSLEPVRMDAVPSGVLSVIVICILLSSKLQAPTSPGNTLNTEVECMQGMRHTQ